MENNRRRKKYIGTPLQKKLLFMVFASAVIPAAIVLTCMYYLIFHALAMQMAFPEAIAYNIMPVLKKVNLVIFICLPVSLLIIWRIALGLSNRIVGPVFRIEKELDEIIQGARKGPIRLRQKDEFRSLVDKINKLIK
jgi:nitrogen fixation/metabolism regulation signal transduction histidine kinase